MRGWLINEKGIVILLDLPNETAATQEMKKVYADFKPECQKSNAWVDGMKMVARVQVHKKGKVESVEFLLPIKYFDDFLA